VSAFLLRGVVVVVFLFANFAVKKKKKNEKNENKVFNTTTKFVILGVGATHSSPLVKGFQHHCWE